MPTRRPKTVKFETITILLGLLIGTVACIAAVMVVPEVRRLLKLDDPTIPDHTTLVTAQTSPYKDDNLMDIFPLFVGAQWTYNYSHFIEPTNAVNPPSNPELGHFTKTIVMVESGLSDRVKIIGLKVAGQNYFNDCANSGQVAYSGDLDNWLVIDKDAMYSSCSRDEAFTIARERIDHPEKFILSSTTLPLFKAPIRVGQLWPAFPDIPSREDTAYQWFVDSQVDVNLPAGEFKGCYRLLLYTNPDETIRWICPKVGLVAEEYHHHGAIDDYRYELQNYSLATK